MIRNNAHLPSERNLHETNTVLKARDDARAQGKKRSEFQPYIPASSSPFVPEGIDPDSLTWAETLAPGGYTHKIVGRGTRIRLEDLTGEACAHIMIFNANEPWERYNAADTVKIPWQAYPTVHHPLLSGEGRVLATIAEDTSNRVDTFCGTTTDISIEEKFGDPSLHGIYPSGQSQLLQAGIKHGLNLRDIPPTISFFQGIHVETDGTFTFLGSTGPKTHIDLLAEMPLIVLIGNSPHPLDPRPEYVSGPIRIHAWKDSPTTKESTAFNLSPERERAYLNTFDYLEAKGI